MPHGLQPFASDPARSRGRVHPEIAALHRDEFQRDRDRVVHSTAFRRLVYKTQVFLNHEGDLFRTRLTHSLEVAQLGRSIARTLGLNEDLVEAIALAHDLGHTPFGHAGQDALDECVRAADPQSAGFEHNFQSLRVVDALEERYPRHDGLNLSFETREGILKHCSARHAQELEASEPGGVAHRFINRTQPSLEAQLCNLADEIAYSAHDIDDGVRSGLLAIEPLLALPAFEYAQRQALAAHPGLAGRRLLFDALRRMLSAQVDDVIQESGRRLAREHPADAAAVRLCGPLIAFSGPMAAQMVEAKQFLRQNLYRHARVVAVTDAAKQVVRDLFGAYLSDATALPAGASRRHSQVQAIADYIAGMTDRYALREHARLFGGSAASILTSPIPGPDAGEDSALSATRGVNQRTKTQR